MCADSVNFGDYLLRNEKWLTEEGVTPGTNSEDGVLSDQEISIFFSNSHINTTADGEITASEFDNWYSANKSAISAYLNEIGASYVDMEVKQAMLESMTEIVHNSEFSSVKLNNLDVDDDITVSDLKMPTASEIKAPTANVGAAGKLGGELMTDINGNPIGYRYYSPKGYVMREVRYYDPSLKKIETIIEYDKDGNVISAKHFDKETGAEDTFKTSIPLIK